MEAEGNFANIERAIAQAAFPLIWLIDAGFVPKMAAISALQGVFRQIPELEWLSGLSQQLEGKPLSMEVAKYRWDSDRFAAADEEELRNWLPGSLQVFRRSLWQSAQGNNLQEKFRNMAKKQLPQSICLHMGDFMQPVEKPLRYIGIGSNPSRKYYHQHVPLLWKWHRKKSDYKPVLRWDAAHGTWFEWGY
jgi:hypothetical protein